MEANIFEFDMEAFLSAKNAYTEAITKFQELKVQLNRDILTLTEYAWNTAAGNTFIEKYSDEWEPILDQYIELLEFLKECIVEGENEFQPIADKIEEIKFKGGNNYGTTI